MMPTESNAEVVVLPQPTRSRRSMLAAAGKAAVLGGLACMSGAVLSLRAKAAGTQTMRCLTVLYKSGDGVKFDFEYYKNHHIPLIMRLYGKAIHRFELRKGLSAMDGSKAAYVAVVNIWIADEAAFDAANAKHTPTLVADVPNFTNTQALIQRDEVYTVATS